MANTVYDNFYLSNEIEDQYKSHLDLQTFCTVDNALEGTAGMLRKINVYKATDGTEKLAMGAGNSKSIEVGFTPREYRIQLAQNRFKYYDEQAMTDPQLVPVGTKHMGTDMFNTVNADIYGEFAKATQVVVVTKLNFDAFADAQSVLALEDLEGVTIFAFVSSADVAELRKELKDTLQYVEAFAKNGYIGTVAGVNIYTKKDAVRTAFTPVSTIWLPSPTRRRTSRFSRAPRQSPLTRLLLPLRPTMRRSATAMLRLLPAKATIRRLRAGTKSPKEEQHGDTRGSNRPTVGSRLYRDRDRQRGA